MLKKEIRKYIYDLLGEEHSRGERVAVLLLHIYNTLIKHNSVYFVKFGITSSKFDLMAVILFHNSEEGLNQLELSKRLSVTQGNITRLVDRMIKDGLLTKEVNKDDRRYNVVKVTPKGSKIVDDSYKGFMDLINSYSAKVEDIERLKELMSEWLFHLKDLPSGGKK